MDIRVGGEVGSAMQKKEDITGGRKGEGGGVGELPCRLQGIKTSEIYSSLDWSGFARFGVASTKKGAILLVTSNKGAVALQGYAVLLFADFNKTALKTTTYDLSSYFHTRPQVSTIDILNTHKCLF